MHYSADPSHHLCTVYGCRAAAFVASPRKLGDQPIR